MDGIRVSVEDRTRAWEHYRKYYSEGGDGDVFQKFYALLGNPPDFTPNSPFYTYPADAARKVSLLAGPYHYTILKAYEACRSLKSVP